MGGIEMAQLIARCGLDCAACEAYQATQAGDLAWKQRIAAEWRERYHNPSFDTVSVTCNGCTSASGPWCSHCSACDIRACCQERGLANCAACPDYACAKLERFFGFVPQVKVTLDAIRVKSS
jgi:hypothetical protein